MCLLFHPDDYLCGPPTTPARELEKRGSEVMVEATTSDSPFVSGALIRLPTKHCSCPHCVITQLTGASPLYINLGRLADYNKKVPNRGDTFMLKMQYSQTTRVLRSDNPTNKDAVIQAPRIRVLPWTVSPHSLKPFSLKKIVGNLEIDLFLVIK